MDPRTDYGAKIAGASRVTLRREGEITAIVRHWSTPATWFGLLFGVVFTFLGAGGLLTEYLAGSSNDRSLLALFVSFAALGGLTLYFGLVSFVNESCIVLMPGRIFVTHGPMPNWLSRPMLARSGIGSVFLTRRLFSPGAKAGTAFLQLIGHDEADTYSVGVLTRERTPVPLLTGLIEPDAKALAELLARELGVPAGLI